MTREEIAKAWTEYDGADEVDFAIQIHDAALEEAMAAAKHAADANVDNVARAGLALNIKDVIRAMKVNP